MSTVGGFSHIEELELNLITPIYPNDVCGNNAGPNYCADAPENQIVSTQFTPSGKYLIVCRLLGLVNVYKVNQSTFTNSNGPYKKLTYDGPYDLESFAINPEGLREFGLTGLIIPDDFDETDISGSPVFFAITTTSNDGINGIARIHRCNLRIDPTDDSKLESVSNSVIREWIDPAIKANAHNIHAGCKFPNKNWIIVPFGDLNDASLYCNNPQVDYGKILLMDYDGNAVPKIQFDTGYPNNMHLAYGNRNMFTLRVLPEESDSNMRFIWGENGNNIQRSVLYSLGEPGQKHNLKWTDGNDNTEWVSLIDPVTGSNAVLFKGADSSGIITIPYKESTLNPKLPLMPSNTSYILHTYMGIDELSSRNRTIYLESISNLGNAPQPAGFIPIKKMIWTTNEFASAPLYTTIHPQTGNFVFGDIFTGNLFNVTYIKPVETDLYILETATIENCSNENVATIIETKTETKTPDWVQPTLLLFTFAIIILILLLIGSKRRQR